MRTSRILFCWVTCGMLALFVRNAVPDERTDPTPVVIDGSVTILPAELVYAYENAPNQVKQQIIKEERSRYELIASLVSSKRILQNLEATIGTEDQDLYYGFQFALLAAAKEFDEKVFQRRLAIPNLEALAEERYRISKQDIAMVPEERWLSHILLLCSDACDEVAKQRELEEIRTKILNGESMSDLALIHSQDPGSRQRGGKLSRGIKAEDPNVDEAFRETAFALAEVGEVSAIVKSRFGFHIMRLEEIVPQRERSFDEIKTSLVEAVEVRYREDAYREYLLSLGPTDDLYIDGDFIDALMGPIAASGADSPSDQGAVQGELP